jgi:valyl-tRNA synthetase
MKGARTLWVPGTDHAGIATQAVVEKKLEKEGKKRRDMSRSDFLEEVWAWKEHSHGIITKQQKSMAISVDWDREAFTMDDNLSHAVRFAFKQLYDRGLIYRDTRMINWDPVQLTGVSDLEVETEEDGEPGKLWHVRYPLQTNRWIEPLHAWGSGRWAEGATEWITIATTRPETILGDTAIMVNPEDDRYTHRIACRAILPALGRWVPIIADRAVDMTFGTGAVKVTPAHDFTDNDVGRRHHLAVIEVMDEHARMNGEAGPYAGLDRFECRKRLVADLEKEGLLVKTEDYMVRLGRGQRSGAVIEPRISKQWFCNMQSMAKASTDAVRNGQLRLVPERFDKIWFNWLDNIRDWCISRQLWWGHQIPVWYVDGDAQTDAGKPTQYCELTEAEAYAKARADWGPDVRLMQDPDVLDTWFSSGLWPFSTLGWPKQSADMRDFYPNTHLETGYDILFFWVARMVMLGIELTGKLPFDTVYLHGLIRTADGKKMSKSRPDKIIDPLELTDTYGTDAVRFYLVTAGTPGNDIKLDAKKDKGSSKWTSERIEGARNFANKLWNVTRFVVGKLDALEGNAAISQDAGSLADQWILARMNQVVAEVRKLNDDYQYGAAGQLIYDFIWSDVCDWYVELSKLSFNPAVIVTVLDNGLRLLHPFMPYVTEELWQKLKAAANGRGMGEAFAPAALILAPYPAALPTDAGAERALAQMAVIQDVIRAIRNARSENKVEVNKRIPVRIATDDAATQNTLSKQRAIVESFAKATIEDIGPRVQPGKDEVTMVAGKAAIYISKLGLIDVEAEKQRLTEELAQTEAQIERAQKLLDSDFGKRAPAAVIQKENEKLSGLVAKRALLREKLALG